MFYYYANPFQPSKACYLMMLAEKTVGRLNKRQSHIMCFISGWGLGLLLLFFSNKHEQLCNPL